MLEYVDKFEDLGERSNRVVSRCQCGRYPVLRTLIDEMGWRETRIECECGLCMVVNGGRHEAILDKWEAMHKSRFVPSEKPYYVGKPHVCCTCRLRRKCVEFRKMDGKSRMECVCNDYAE